MTNIERKNKCANEIIDILNVYDPNKIFLDDVLKLVERRIQYILDNTELKLKKINS